MKKYWLKLIILIALLGGLLSCSDRRELPYEYTELAMEPGMHIEATNKNGTVVIDYMGPLKRRFRWDDYDEERILIPRKERLNGRLGAYDPADAWIWEVWEIRIVSNDSQLHFETMEEIDKRLYQGMGLADWVYTDDGLVVGFFRSPDRNQVNIDVYQIYLNGEKPKYIKGSRPENIKVSYQ